MIGMGLSALAPQGVLSIWTASSGVVRAHANNLSSGKAVCMSISIDILRPLPLTLLSILSATGAACSIHWKLSSSGKEVSIICGSLSSCSDNRLWTTPLLLGPFGTLCRLTVVLLLLLLLARRLCIGCRILSLPFNDDAAAALTLPHRVATSISPLDLAIFVSIVLYKYLRCVCVPPSFGFTSLVKFTRLIVILGFWLGAFVVVFFFSDALDGELLRDPFACVMLDNFVEPGLSMLSIVACVSCLALDVKEMKARLGIKFIVQRRRIQ